MDKTKRINRATLRLSVQGALLGVIGVQVLAVSIEVKLDQIEMKVFVEGTLSEDEREAFNVAATEIMGDFAPIILVDVIFFEKVSSPIEIGEGFLVFLRYGCRTR
jgi:hypothetical protein